MEEVCALKVRIKFSKEGHTKFIGHLDTMRYFQKAVRRAALPVAYSGGYSPHMIMSFAAPLGVGVTSTGEYFDMELTETLPTEEIAARLDAVMAEGFSVLCARQVEDKKASTAMALVAAADYRISFRKGRAPEGWKERVIEFAARKSIPVLKKTKKSEREIDIRPFIYEIALDGEYIFLKLASASANYTKPELVMDTFLQWMGEELVPFSYQVQRCEVYADKGTEGSHVFVSLQDLGEEVE